jgi:hypothetical protein
MDASTVRAMLEQHFEYGRSDPDKAQPMYHDDAVLEFPQRDRRLGAAGVARPLEGGSLIVARRLPGV